MKKLLALLLLTVVTLTSCNIAINPLPKEMPDDFSFSIIWGTFGISSYDSKSGVLIKEDRADDVEKYTTTYFLCEDELREIYGMIYEFNVGACPDKFPYGTFVGADPYSTLELSVSTGNYSKTIKADEVGAYESYTARGEAYLDVILYIRDILISTEEWKALPDYENYFY